MALCHVEKAPDLRRAGQRNDIDRPGRQLIDKCQDRLVSDVRGVFVGRYRIGNGARALKKGDKLVASAGVKLHADTPTAQIKAGKQGEDALRRRLFRAQLRLCLSIRSARTGFGPRQIVRVLLRAVRNAGSTPAGWARSRSR